MADSEVQILISLKDEVTDGFNRIQNTLEKGNKNISNSTEKTIDSFRRQITTLQTVGNVMQGVDNIFSSYTNLQIRLENAQERLANATDRLANANEGLNRVYQNQERVQLNLRKLSLQEEDSKSRLKELYATLTDMQNRDILPNSQRYAETVKEIEREELNLKDIQLSSSDMLRESNQKRIDSQNEIVRATRGLEIAQNNLERANNAVTGTYINMGMQSLGIISSLQMLSVQADIAKNSVVGLGGAIGTSTAGTVLGGLGLVGLIGGMIIALKAIDTAVQQKELEDLRKKTEELGNVADTTRQKWVDLQKTMYPSGGTAKTSIPTLNIPINSQTIDPNTAKKTYNIPGWGDFISRPGQGIQSFSPDDTIIGTKDMGNLSSSSYNIIIEGDNYGIDAESIADSLMERLKRKVTL